MKMTQKVITHSKEKLHEEYSPEQISCTMRESVGIKVSHERIYQHIWRDKEHGGDLFKKLSIAGVRYSPLSRQKAGKNKVERSPIRQVDINFI
jgi:IS30 family transposase